MASISTLSRLSAVMTLDITRFMTNTEIVSARLKKLRADAVAFGQGFTRVFSFGFALIGAAAIKTAADFDQLNAQLEAVTGGRGLEDLTKQAKTLGRETIFTATQIAELQLELAKLGFAAEDVATAVDATSKISAVFGGDLVKTGTTIAEAVRQFSNSNLDAARVADIMAVAFQKSALSTDNFGQALKNVGSVANITGNDFETTVALLGTLANAGQKGGIAGTRLKGVFIRLGKQLGVTGEELQLLTSGQLDFNQLIDIFRNRAGVAAAVISELGDEFELLRQELYESYGAAAALESGLNDRMFFALKRIEAATEAAGIAIGEAFGPLLEAAATMLSLFAKSVEDADDGTVQLIVTLGAVAAILPVVVFAVTQLVSALTFLYRNPAVAVLAALVTMAIAVRTEYELTTGVIKKFDESLRDLNTQLGEELAKAAETTQKRIDVLREEMEKLEKQDLGAEAKAEAMGRLQDAADKLQKRLDTLESFDGDLFGGAIEKFVSDVKSGVDEVKLLKRQLRLARKAINEAEIELSNLGMGASVADFLNAEDLVTALQTTEAVLKVDLAIAENSIDNAAKELGEAFGEIDLSLFSESQLRAQQTEINNMGLELERTLLKLQEMSTGFFGSLVRYIGATVNLIFGSIGAFFGLFDGTFAERAKENDERFFAMLKSTETIEGEILDIEARITANKELQAKYQDEINKKLAEQQARVEEAQKLADAYADIFGDAADAADSIDAFQKLKESLIDTAAAFSSAEGDATKTRDLIDSLTNSGLDLTSVLQSGAFDLDVFGAFKGDAENSLKAVKDATSAFDEFIKVSIAAGKFDLADIFLKLKERGEDLASSMERVARLEALAETAEDAEKLAKALKTAGIADELEVLRSILSPLEAQLKGTFAEDGVVDEGLVKRILEIRAQIEALQATAKGGLKLELGFADPRNIGEEAGLKLAIDLLEKQMAASVAKVNEEFNKLNDATALFSDQFSLGGQEGVLDMQKLNEAIGTAKATLGSMSETHEDYNEVAANLQALQAFRDLVDETGVSLALSQENLEAYVAQLQTVQDSVGFKNQIKQLDNLETALGSQMLSPLEKAQEKLSILTDLYAQASVNADLLAGTRFTNLGDLAAELSSVQAQVTEMERLQGIMQFVNQQMQFVGDAFIAAARDGEDFFTALKDGFKNMFLALIGKLITLIALFAVLNILTGGAFMAGGSAGMDFSSFLAQGFGIPTKTASAGSAGIGAAIGNTKGMAIQGSISGNNIVLSNQRGTRAMDRTFG